jgi:hypothetical protein
VIGDYLLPLTPRGRFMSSEEAVDLRLEMTAIALEKQNKVPAVKSTG